jgi:transcription antitermination factor NusG
MLSWYALHVETGQELAVTRALRKMGTCAIVPMEMRRERSGGRTRERLHVYVPGYVFIRLEGLASAYNPIRCVPHVFRFLGGGTPDRIPDDQMRMMLALAEHGETMRPAPASRIDGKTVITGGPLARLNPTILSADTRSGRATIEVKVLEHSCRTTIQIQLG